MILKGSSGSSMPSLASALRGAIHTFRQIPSRETAQQPNAVQCSAAQTTQKRNDKVHQMLVLIFSGALQARRSLNSVRDAEQLEVQMSKVL